MSLRHRIDPTVDADGCIAKASFTLERSGGGCALNLFFDGVAGGVGGLTKVRLDADWSCPGFPSETEGVYEAEPGHGPWWYAGPRDVLQSLAAGACLGRGTITFPDAPIVLRRTSPGPIAVLTVNLRNLSIGGELFSAGDTTETCVSTSGCANGYHDGGAGWCVPLGSCTPGYGDDGTGACVPTGCAAAQNFCDGACRPESPQHCGARCATCPPPASNGVATCTNGQCGVRCSEGFGLCADSCVSLATVSNCGACGIACEGDCSTGECLPTPGCTYGSCTGDKESCNLTTNRCEALTCHSGNAQPDTCGHAHYCASDNGCYDLPAASCGNFAAWGAYGGPRFNPLSSAGPVIYHVEETTDDAAFCRTTQRAFTFRIYAYRTDANWPANLNAITSAFSHVNSAGIASSAYPNMRPGGYLPFGREAVFKVTICAPLAVGAFTAGFVFSGGNEYCTPPSSGTPGTLP